MKYLKVLIFILISALTLIGKWNESYIMYTSILIVMILFPVIVVKPIISSYGLGVTRKPNFGKLFILYFLFISTYKYLGDEFLQSVLFFLDYILIFAWFILDLDKKRSV